MNQLCPTENASLGVLIVHDENNYTICRRVENRMLSKTVIWNHNDVVPPLLFDCVSPGVYRSNAFGRENFSFIKSLDLQCIVYIGETGVGEEIESFAQKNRIQLVCI